jgi:hypothetical protein
MRGIWRNMLPAVGLLILLSGIPAMAQEETLNVNIPFRFIAENTTLPAGEYVVEWPDLDTPMVAEIRSEKGDHSVFVLTTGATLPSNQKAKSELVFDKVGKKEFLAQIWREDSPTGYEVPRSKIEKLAEHNAALSAHRHSVTAHHKAHKKIS